MVRPYASVPEVLSRPSRKRKAAQQLSRTRQFVKGPVPMSWLEQAARLPGKVLAVAMLIWFRKGMVGDKRISISPRLLKRIGVGRKAAGRALTALEQAGLIRADRASGRLARVQILNATSLA